MYSDVLTSSSGVHLNSHVTNNPSSSTSDAHNPCIQSKSQKRGKPPPLDINSKQSWSTSLNPLVEFAAIATSPQSPLVQHNEHVIHDTSTHDQLENYFESNQKKVKNKSSTIGCSSHFWDHEVESSNIRLSSSLWQVRSRDLVQESCLENGSVINKRTNTDIESEERKKETNEIIGMPCLFRAHTMKPSNKAGCPTEQFWSTSYFTEDIPSTNHRDISRDQIFEELCSPPLNPVTCSTSSDPSPEQSTTSVLFDSDSAVHALSNMAKRKEEYQKYCKTNNNSMKRKVVDSKRKRNDVYTLQAKRPMNSFMLFAKRYRLELTQKHPGKDNRAISVILGDQWKSLSYEDRKTYIMEAKILAEEHKRIYPDCWKRKRTQVSIGRNRKC